MVKTLSTICQVPSTIDSLKLLQRSDDGRDKSIVHTAGVTREVEEGEDGEEGRATRSGRRRRT